MSLLAELGSEPRVPQWRHWIVGVEPIGRITLPAGARHVLGTEVLVQAVSRERMLGLRRVGVGASLPIDSRGRLVLPTWFRGVGEFIGLGPGHSSLGPFIDSRARRDRLICQCGAAYTSPLLTPSGRLP